MTDDLNAFIESLKTNNSLIVYDEAATKQVVVLRLLNLLGWNPFDINEVTPEYIIGNNRVDYALKLNNKIKVFLEVKRVQEDLEIHQEQLLKYAFQEGIKLAVLTNGISWWMYLPLQEGSWQQRKFFSIDILQQKTIDIIAAFEKYLLRANVASGESIKHAEDLIRSVQKKNILKLNMPIAWNAIISEPDELLIELIEEKTERICGFRPSPDEVSAFLQKYYNQLSTNIPEPQRLEKSNRKVEKESTFIGYSENYQRKEVKSFTFLGKKYHVNKWKDLLVTMAGVIFQNHRDTFQKVFSLRGSKREYFSESSQKMREPVKINSSNIYVETHWSANDIAKITRRLLLLFGYQKGDLKIELGEKERKQKVFRKR